MGADQSAINGETKAAKPWGPAHVTADLIRVRVILNGDGGEAQLSQVWTDGHVHVEQPQPGSDRPLTVDATRMHMRSQGGKDDQILDIYGHSQDVAGRGGAPAHVRSGGMHIAGYAIHLDRLRNEAGVKGQGLLQLPMTQGLDGKKLDAEQPLDIAWSERMDFNGKTALFYGKVRAALDQSALHCEEMEVHLTDHVSFAEPVEREARQHADVHLVFCRDGVTFDSDQYESGQVQDIYRGEFAELRLDRKTGLMKGHGPGVVNLWRRGNANRTAVAPTTTVRANAGLKAQAVAWEFMQITFAGEVDGNIGAADQKVAQRTTTFHDQVKVVYGPADRPHAQFTIEDLPRDAGWMECRTLHVTQHVATETVEAWVDLVADGDARLEGNREGRTFRAMADIITYDHSKGVYRLRSLAPNRCQIWHQAQPGAPSNQSQAQVMTFIPSQNILHFDQATGASGNR